jgi:hypothetical protein
VKVTFPSQRSANFLRLLVDALVRTFLRIPNFQVTEAFANSVAGNTFQVYHTLGLKPSAVLPLPYSQANVWATESDRLLWTDKVVVLRSSVANGRVTLLIVGQEIA